MLLRRQREAASSEAGGEALVVPFALDGGGGTLWAVAEGGRAAFEAEDARLLQSLARLASASHRVASSLEALREAQEVASSLRRQERALRRVLDILPVAAYTCDADGLLTHYNRQAAQVWGREPKLRDPADRFCGSLRMYERDGTPVPHERCGMARALREGEPVGPREVLIERPDGERIAVLAHASPVRDEDGGLIGAVNVVVDVTERLRAQEALRESEQRFVRFMERLPGLAWIKDLDGRYVFVNEAVEGAFRRPSAEILGRTDDEIFPGDTARQFRSNDARALASVSGVEAIETLDHADGVHHSLVSKFPIPAAHGRPALVGGIAIDITERMRAEEALRTSEQIHRAIGESIDYGVWVCDAEGRNVYASESFLKLVGLTQEQCSEFGWGAVLHPDEAERTLAAWRECVRSGRPWDVEHRFRGVDGRWHPVLARGVRIENERGETTAWAGINLDISRLKQVEEELREADRRKDEFLATLAHELRNPLAPIRNALSVLRMSGGGSGAGPLIETMERQVDQMVRLVDDLLEVSRVTRGKIDLRRERVGLSVVVRAAVEMSRPLLEAARHRLEIALPDEEPFLEADPVRLSQVFANLLNNAAKYTEPGGRVAIGASREGGEVSVWVRDDGVGIPADQLAGVFDLFRQVDATRSRAQGGLGIGLTLVQRLVQLHGGRVEARSDGLGRGSEFRVTLPLASAPARAAARGGSEREHRSRLVPPRRVLVVDDNRDAADSLGVLLGVLGADCRVAHDGSAALAALADFPAELVLLDLGMPGLDGYDVARLVRAREDGHAPRLVALTGWGQPADRRRTLEAGFDGHLVKPVDVKTLRSLLESLEAPRSDSPAAPSRSE
jgi:PAS domain S-box-containing protein